MDKNILSESISTNQTEDLKSNENKEKIPEKDNLEEIITNKEKNEVIPKNKKKKHIPKHLDEIPPELMEKFKQREEISENFS